MKILPFTIPKSKRDTILLQEDKGSFFYELLHRHEEIQISEIIEGDGTLIVRDTICLFKKGDIIILGGNIPHVFKSNPNMGKSQMRTVFFTEQSFGVEFFKIEELKSLQSFFKKAKNGFRITSKKQIVTPLLDRLFVASKLDRFIIFLQLLKSINLSKYEFLSNSISEKRYNDQEGRRMSIIFEYTINNFQKKIPLIEIAKQAAMTKNAFCKYFKKRTNKTYISFLNELRVEEAGKLMQANKELSIVEISELSGFNNISNFNRKFKLFKGKTPSQYRKELGL